MAIAAKRSCRVDYRSDEIVVHGPVDEAREEAKRIVKRFACSATPYRIDEVGDDRVILKPD